VLRDETDATYFTVYWLALLIYIWEARVEIVIQRCIFKEIMGTEHGNFAIFVYRICDHPRVQADK